MACCGGRGAGGYPAMECLLGHLWEAVDDHGLHLHTHASGTLST